MEVRKLEDEIKKAFLVEKLRIVKQGAYNHIDKWEDYHHELVSLLLWLRLCLTKHSDQGIML